MECFLSDTVDSMIIAYVLLGFATGVICSAVWVDGIYKKRQDL